MEVAELLGDDVVQEFIKTLDGLLDRVKRGEQGAAILEANTIAYFALEWRKQAVVASCGKTVADVDSVRVERIALDDCW